MSTWADIKTQLEAAIAAHDFNRKSYAIESPAGGQRFEFHDLDSLTKFYDKVCEYAAKEAAPSFRGRTYAKQGGRG